MKTRKANTKTATPTSSKKGPTAKSVQKSTKLKSTENSLTKAGKSTPAGVKPTKVLEEKSNAGEQEKVVLKKEDAKPSDSAGEGLEDKSAQEGSEVEIPAGTVEDGASLAGEHSAEDLAAKTSENDQEEENDDHSADAKPAEKEEKDDAGNQAEVPDANVVDAYSELQNTMSASERRKRKRLQVFVGGLDREATEDDLRQLFEKMGEITELRLMMDAETGKNKGYAFVRYSTQAEAKRAVKELADTKIREKKCGVVIHEEKDTLFLGNIDKNWTKDELFNKLKEVGVENIDDVTVIEDPNNTGVNRGFAFLELGNHKDAQMAFKALVKKNVFGEDRKVKVAWAQPLNDPDEDEMAQVKSVFVHGLQPTWNEEQVKEHFGKFGEIERVVLASNIESAKRKDFGFVNYTTREAAIACIEAFSKDDELVDRDSKVKVKVSLAKPAKKRKNGKREWKGTNKGDSKEINKGDPEGINKGDSEGAGKGVSQAKTNKGDSKGASKGVSQGHVRRNQSSNRSTTTAGAASGKRVLGKRDQRTLPSATQGKGFQPTLHSATHGKGDQPTLPSATHEILHILRQQAAWGGGHAAVSGGHVGGLEQTYTVPHLQPMSSVQGYGQALPGVKRPYTALGDISVDSRGNPRARLESTIAAGGSSYGLSASEQGSLYNHMFTGASVGQGGSSYGLSASGQGSLSNPMYTGASVGQFYHHPSIGLALGGPYAPGSASYVPIGLQGSSAHGDHRGGAGFHG